MTFADWRFAIVIGTLSAGIVIIGWMTFYQAIVSGVFQ